MAANKLSDADVETALKQLPAWTLKSGKLHREYKFSDFAHAFGFMAIAAIRIDKINHHPEWSNVYNRVVVDLTTHDAGGITDKDFTLARRIEDLALWRPEPGSALEGTPNKFVQGKK
jgi:4a-hydroxytetrahydrobiopterin dehydratase